MIRLPRLPWLSRERIREDVSDELEFHLEMRAEELARGGLSPADARRRAREEFGDLAAARHALGAADERRQGTRRRREWWMELRQDLSLGTRQLRRRPGFALLVALTLGLGIGAATAIFGLADHVLLRPLPYHEPERVLTLWEVDRRSGEDRREVSPGDYLAWSERAGSFSVMGLGEPYGFDLTGGGTAPEPVNGWLVTEGFLPALGVPPLLGRGFRAEDAAPNAAPVVMVSEGLWRRRYGGDPSLVGRRIELNDMPTTVVGIVPGWVDYPEKMDVWAPKIFPENELTNYESGYMRVVARLKPSTTPREAQADLDRVAATIAAENPATTAGQGVNAVTLEDTLLGEVRPALLILLGAVGFLLLIACANVAGLLLARGAERGHEMGLRTALGAGRGRLARQLLTESLVLGALGGAVGVGMAVIGVRALVALSPPDLPRLETVTVDARMLVFACAATLAAVALFGLAPALRVSHANPLGVLRSGAASLTGGRARLRARGALVVGEIALATVLLIGAGLLARSFVTLLDNDLGFSSERRAALQLFLWERNPTPEQRIQRTTEIVARMEGLPGVEEVAVVSTLPFHPQPMGAQDALLVEGRATPAGQAPRVFTSVASPNYFALMGIPLRRGRAFTAEDRADAPMVALVSEALARRLFPGEDPVGKRVTIGVWGPPLEREIVGVVGDVRPSTLDSDPRAELFAPFAQSGTGSLTFVARTRTDPAALLGALQARVWEADPAQTVSHAATLDAMVSATLVERRFNLFLLGALSTAALALAAIGIYGLISFATRQRVREIGIRLALGAGRGTVVRMIVRDGLRLGIPGVLLGVMGALLLTRLMRGMLYGVAPTDAATYLQLGTLLLLVSLLGAYLPARRASRLDPMRALRE